MTTQTGRPDASPARSEKAGSRRKRSNSASSPRPIDRASAAESTAPSDAAADTSHTCEDAHTAGGCPLDNVGGQTPRKKKRVRFSDPGPIDGSLDDSPDVLSTSTGLTPHMSRFRLLSSPMTGRVASPQLRRRASLPTLSFRESLKPRKIQFLPMRDVLDPRMKRRLRRSHLSEEINNITEERRQDEKQKLEVAHLRSQAAMKEQKINDLLLELEAQRQLGIRIDNEEEERVAAMSAELDRLRSELASRCYGNELHEDASMGSTNNPGFRIWEDDDYADYASTIPDEPPSPSPSHSSSQLCRRISFHELRDTPNPAPGQSPHISHDFPEGDHAQGTEGVTAIQALRGLGFSAHPEANVSQVVHRVQEMFRTARLDLENLLPGETAGGFDNSTLLNAMLGHIRNLLTKVEEKRRAVDASTQSEAALRGNLDRTLERVADLENRITVLLAQRQDLTNDAKRMEQAAKELELASQNRIGMIDERDDRIEKLKEELKATGEQVKMLERELGGQKTSTERLKAALTTTRDEAVSLEALLTTTEADKNSGQHRINILEGVVSDLRSRNGNLNKALEETREGWRASLLRTRKSLDGLKDDFCKECERSSLELDRVQTEMQYTAPAA